MTKSPAQVWEEAERLLLKQYEARNQELRAKLPQPVQKTPNRRDKAETAEVRRLITEARTGPCSDCRVTYPSYITELDHVPERGRKLFALSTAIKLGISAQLVAAELLKCDRVCAKCHRERTHARHLAEWLQK